jgi:hypothetical protein
VFLTQPFTFVFASNVCMLVPLRNGFPTLPVRHIFDELRVSGWLIH